MTERKVKTNKLSIYLIKPAYNEPQDIIDSQEAPIHIDDVGPFYFEESHPHEPDWLHTFFGESLRKNLRIFASSARGILMVPVTVDNETRCCAVSFGIGRYMLKGGVVEERFGLKVVLNSIDIGSFRSIDKTSLGSVPKHSREQMSRDVPPSDFGIDVEQDLVSSVTGKSNDERLGKVITGKDALTVSVKVDVANVRDFLSHCLKRYRSIDYRKNFDWIDQIADVRDRCLEEKLDNALVDKLKNGDREKIWMAVPEVIDWAGIDGFRYIREKRAAALHDDLDVDDFLKALADEELTLDALKKKYVFMISTTAGEMVARWPVFRCMYAEVSSDGKLYVLNNAKWYEVAATFAEEVQKDFDSTPLSAVELPDCTVEDEGKYNKAAAAGLPGACCMDGELVQYGGGHSSIEFCDVYTHDGKLVHVKRYGGSSVLSHLFAQGAVSGEVFVSDAGFREKLNAKLPLTHRLADPRIRPTPQDYEIVYAIISESSKLFDIPFFSKVSLRNARRRLGGFGFTVTRKKIQKAGSSGSTQ